MTPALVTGAEVGDAVRRIEGRCLRTPLVPVAHGDDVVHVKAESLQPTGAFKLRGATNAVLSLPPERLARGVVTHSSGNHGRAVAHVARALRIRATVVVPEGATEGKVRACADLGARIVRVPASERAAACDEIAAETGAEVIPPYDDRRVIAGQGTVGWEVVDDLPDVAVVLVPVGGGGLVSGIAAAVKHRSPATRVVGVEPALAADLVESLLVGEPVAWSPDLTSRTVADGLRASRVGDLPWAHIQALVDDVVTVTEEQIVAAMRFLALSGRLVAEPSGAVATAAWLVDPARWPGGRTVAVCSGGNVDSALLRSVLA